MASSRVSPSPPFFKSRRAFTALFTFLFSTTLLLFIIDRTEYQTSPKFNRTSYQSFPRFTDEPSKLVSRPSGLQSNGGGHNCSDSRSLWHKWTSNIRACLLQQIKETPSVWAYLHLLCKLCVGEAGFNMMGVKLLRNHDDVKLVVLPKLDNSSSLDKAPCTVVTLGIGHDVAAELELQRLLPYCEFYGADPSSEAGSVYDTDLNGTYFQAAVAADDGDTTASIIEKNGTYNWHSGVKAISLLEFLSVNVSRIYIDYMFMDNEGPEYAILEQFLHGGLLDVEGVVVCQLSVELHGPPGTYGMNETGFAELIRVLVANSSMLPIWAAPPGNHVRAYLINYQHPFCIDKYFLL